MMPNVVGIDAAKAETLLTEQGFRVSVVTYVSRRGIENADSTRVIRVRELGNNHIEITVSHFKTQVS